MHSRCPLRSKSGESGYVPANRSQRTGTECINVLYVRAPSIGFLQNLTKLYTPHKAIATMNAQSTDKQRFMYDCCGPQTPRYCMWCTILG